MKDNEQSSVDKTIEKITRRLRKAERENYRGILTMQFTMHNGGVSRVKCDHETVL